MPASAVDRARKVPPIMFPAPKKETTEIQGVVLAFSAYVIWGLFPLYFVLLRDVPPLVTLAFRATFTTLLLAPLFVMLKKGKALVCALRNPRYVLGLFVTMATTMVSWGFFIWLVAINHTLYASLGNYGCPLVTVALGAIVFRERLRPCQLVAIGMAAVAVAIFAFGVGRLPWESVVVSFVFAIYSLLRKMINVDSTTALSVETIFALPFALAYLVFEFMKTDGIPTWALAPTTLLLLIGAGVLTAIPLLLFGAAAHKCKLSTIGLLIYITPTGQFLCGAFILHEKTSVGQWISFVLIWIALICFTVDLIRHDRKEELSTEG